MSLSDKEYNLREIEEVFNVNGDFVFTYKDKEYFFTFYGEPDNPKRCFRIAPRNNHEDALKSDEIIWIEDPTIEGVKIDGKTLPEIADEIVISSEYV